VTAHRVLIEPTHRSRSRQFYRATLDGEELVARSWSPMFAACRALKARGLSGRVEFFRAGVPHPCAIVRDLVQGAELRIHDDECQGPILKKWQPSRKDNIVSLSTPSAKSAAFAD
jgi:hypothetical protein